MPEKAIHIVDRYERVLVETRGQWRKWLKANHRQSQSVWVVTNKKPSGHPHVPYNDLVEEALCYGWIDSRPAKLDERRSMLLVSPRRPGSAWSKLNKERADRLIAAGLMTAAGLARIEQAKLDGTWSRLDEVESLVLPQDLAQTLARNRTALRYFEAFSASAKKGILQWIQSARRPETRAARITETVELAAKNIRANQWPRPK